MPRFLDTTKKISIFFLIAIWIFSVLLLILIEPAQAAVSVTAATGGGAISADTTGGSYTTLTGPTLVEGASKDIGTGTIIFNAPSGFEFNTGATVTATITLIEGSKACFAFSSNFLDNLISILNNFIVKKIDKINVKEIIVIEMGLSL